MSGAARKLVETFESLPEEKQQKVLAELQRQGLASGYASPDESDLIFTAEQVFLELERREEQN